MQKPIHAHKMYIRDLSIGWYAKQVNILVHYQLMQVYQMGETRRGVHLPLLHHWWWNYYIIYVRIERFCSQWHGPYRGLWKREHTICDFIVSSPKFSFQKQRQKIYDWTFTLPALRILDNVGDREDLSAEILYSAAGTTTLEPSLFMGRISTSLTLGLSFFAAFISRQDITDGKVRRQ